MTSSLHAPANHRGRRDRKVYSALCLLGMIAAVVLFTLYCHWRPDCLGNLEVRMQLAGDTDSARAAVDGKKPGCRPASDEGVITRLQAAVRNDSKWLIQAYGLFLAAAFGFGALHLYRPLSRAFALRGLIATPVVMAVDHAENVWLLLALDRMNEQPGLLLTLASCFALIKWPMVVLLGGAAIWVAATLSARRVLGWRGMTAKLTDEDGKAISWPRLRSVHTGAEGPGPVPTDADIIAPSMAPHASTPLPEWSAARVAEHQGANSALARWRTRALPLPGREAAAVGICVSGGGIRSASVTLGALQALRAGGVLARARYLVSVSGGGYTAGAFQLALTGQVPPHLEKSTTRPANLATPADAFAPGSPEEDHIRRHAKYLADGPGEAVRAAGTVLRGVLVSLGLLTLASVVAGLFLQVLYGSFPTIVDLRCLRPPFDPDPPWSSSDGGLPGLRLHQHVVIPVGVLLGLAASMSLIDAVRRVITGVSRPAWLRNALKSVVWLAVAVAVFAVLIPTLLWLVAWLTHDKKVMPGDGEGVSALATITAGLTWLGALFAAGFRRDEKVKPDGEKAGFLSRNSGKIFKAVGTGWVVRVVVWLVLLVLAFVFLFIVFWVTVSADRWHWGLKSALAGGLLVAAVLLDQTAFSLHPFYRQRLAGAFAVRRAVLKDGSVGSLPYDYNRESTELSTHAAKVPHFPQVIFAASAALSSRNRTPPGRPAVSFTFASDYVGGPDVGWVKTATMERTAHPLIRRDLTVQSAMAVSGAAFASTMGTQTSAAQRLFTLSNLRLGTWVPNPAYLAEVAREGPLWTMPRLPRVRRLRYQLQELVGRYSDTSPMLLCTDGGHFDNLGLVELLRLRCRTIYVIDSAGDSPPLATTLAQAVTLAYEDLGVEITFNQEEALRLVPGSADTLAPEAPLAALNARLSADCVVVGSILYPEAVDFGDGVVGREGTIVVAKASLTPDLPYELLSYALQEKAFPRQATADQWFDHTQFDAYRALGHHLGARAAAAGAPG
ncbi:hypothetical protein GCM10010252_53470 [Streptomyces aureoverticillatus]|nr:hypothetical protein GCM10010252_53470 [Streptomyces aureoverticillatus]